jgi:hypothetical protein
MAAVTVAALGGPDLLGPPDAASVVGVLVVLAVAILATAVVELRTTREGAGDDAP